MPEVDLSTKIQQAAEGPASVTTDGVSVTARSVSEIIEAERYLKERAAGKATGKLPGVRVQKIVAGGAS